MRPCTSQYAEERGGHARVRQANAQALAPVSHGRQRIAGHRHHAAMKAAQITLFCRTSSDASSISAAGRVAVAQRQPHRAEHHRDRQHVGVDEEHERQQDRQQRELLRAAARTHRPELAAQSAERSTRAAMPNKRADPARRAERFGARALSSRAATSPCKPVSMVRLGSMPQPVARAHARDLVEVDPLVADQPRAPRHPAARPRAAATAIQASCVRLRCEAKRRHRALKKRSPGRYRPGLRNRLQQRAAYSAAAASVLSGRSTSSTYAIGALSPSRKPHFRMRR